MIKQVIAGVAVVGVIAGGVGVDASINPYRDVTVRDHGKSVPALEIRAASKLTDAGEVATVVYTGKPRIELQKWGGEAKLGITSLDIASDTEGKRPAFSDKVEWKNSKVKMEAVPLEATATMEDGGMEINIHLDEKPASNVFTFQLDNWENLDFFYQPALTQQDIDEGASRPDNVVGSYAVYYQNHANHRLTQITSTEYTEQELAACVASGECVEKNIDGLPQYFHTNINYATGKAYHIFRPLVTDADGKTTWAELGYADGVLTVTVPEDFLDGAAYPVVVDPTFGYTTIGASSAILESSNGTIRGTDYSATESGTVTSITAYLTGWEAGKDIGFGIYRSSDNVLVGDSGASTAGGADGWQTLNVSSSITAQTYGLVARAADHVGTDTGFNYDAISQIRYFKSAIGGYSIFPSPFDGTKGSAAFQYSIYATYTADAATPTTTKPPTINTGSIKLNTGHMIINN